MSIHAQRKARSLSAADALSLGTKRPGLSLEHAAQGGGHVLSVGITGTPKVRAAAARTGLGHAPGPVHICRVVRPIQLLLARLNHGLEPRRGAVPFGRRVASLPPRLQRRAETLRRETTRRDALEPFRIDACFGEPSRQSHRLYRPSNRHVLDDRDRDTGRVSLCKNSVPMSRK